jgi:hypothetical protein
MPQKSDFFFRLNGKFSKSLRGRGESMLEAFRAEFFTLLKSCHDRREARVMLAQAQLRLTREHISDLQRDQFWKGLLEDLKLASEEFAAADVFAAALAEITLYSIRCGRSPPHKAQ